MARDTDTPYVLTAAHVQRDQWVGTAAAEEDMHVSESLHELVDLDRSRFSILTIELNVGTEKGAKSSVKVYAIDRARHSLADASHEELMAFVRERGDAPVTQFEVHGVRAEQIMQRLMKRFQVRLHPHAWQDTPMLVDQLDDLLLSDESGQ